MKRPIIVTSLFCLNLLLLSPVLAVDVPADWQSGETGAIVDPLISVEPPLRSVETYNLHVDTPTLSRGYTAEPFDGQFRVGIFPEVLNQETDIVFKEFSQPDQWHPAPFAMEYQTNIYEYDIKNQAAFKNEKPVIIEIKYPKGTPANKQAYFWNKPTQSWVLMPTTDLPLENKIRAIIHLPYARIALLAYPPIMEYGYASWYKYKDCDCAASVDYAKGTQLEVTNLDNNKMIIVTVNDYGPERDKHPERNIDLDVLAFKKIGDKTLGIIRTRVVPVNK
ncbi:MAG: septal ring lytic transglycosylase RlpA family protein [bacterium]